MRSQALPWLRGVPSRAVTGVDSQLHHERAISDLGDPSSKAPSRHHQDLVFKHLDALWVCKSGPRGSGMSTGSSV